MGCRMREINRIIVHCSDSPNDVDVTVDDIREWHKERGWSDIGYHYVIYRNGNLLCGRPVHKVGAHCKGYNHDSIGICLIGRSDFTDEQFNKLRWFISNMKHIFGDLDVKGHRDFNSNKTCPNFYVEEVLL